MTSPASQEAQLRAEVADLRARLQEAEDTLRAIRTGEVDSLVVETNNGPQVFSLDSAEAASNRLRGEVLAQVSDAVIAVDPEEHIIFCNAAAERQYGLATAAALGRKLSEIHTCHWASGEAEAVARNALREHGEWRGEAVHRLRDGRELPVESSVAVLRHGDGTEAGTVAIIRDITGRKFAERRLHEQEERQRFALQAASAGAWDWDIRSGDVVWSPENYVLYDLDPALGLPGYADWTSRIHPDDLARTNEMVRAVVEGDVPEFRSEFRVVHGGGRIVWLLGIGRVQRDGGGKALRLSGINLDITARKRTEEELQRVSLLLDTLLNTAPIGFCFFDRELRCVRINERLAAINGLPAEAHIGRHVSEIVPALADALHEVTDRILATGEAVLDHEFSGETPAAPGETRCWNESWYPVRDDAGEIIGFGGIVEDITARKLAEERLLTSEKQVRQVINSMFTFVGMIAPDGTLMDTNHAPLAAAGLTRSDVIGRPFWECYWWDYDPAVQDRLRAGFNRAVRGEVVQYEETIRGVDDTRIIIDFMLQPVFDGGRLVFVIPSAQDITARKQAETALQASEEFNRTVLESSPDCIKVLDGKGRVEFVNRSGLCLMETDGVGAGPDQPWSEGWPEAERSQVRAAVEQALHGEVARFIAPRPTAQGKPRWWDVIVAPIAPAGGEGGVASLISVSRDITAQKAAEADLLRRTAELRESETRMRLATEATAVGIWELNATTHTLRWDAQMFRIYGIAPTTDGLVQYIDWSGAVLPEDLVESESVPLQDTVRRRDFRIRRRDDGEVRNIEAVEALRVNQQGEAEWVVGTNLDVTERKHAERQLRELTNRLTEADQRKDQFLATLAHELRNPLAPIRNALELLKRESGDGEVCTQAREIMERQIAHMVRLTDDLLDVSRIGRDTVELKTARIELASVIHHAVEACRPDLDRFRHEFVLTVPSAPIHLQGDATRLTQVIGNLLTNASKYSDAGGTIWLTVQREPSDVKIIVKDTGIGMPPEMLGQVFHMFTQIDTSVERSVGGLGIGLWLVKQLVELHGGTVTAHSDGPGHGSEFTVRLPLLVDQPRTDAPAQIPAAPMNASGRRILVVDDNFDNVTTLALLLKHTGNEVRTASDGLEAIAAAETFRPDVIFLDIGLPKLNGHDTCRAIRKEPWGTDILILALTGWGQEEDRRKSADAGFDVHLVKPVDYSALNDLMLKLKPRATTNA